MNKTYPFDSAGIIYNEQNKISNNLCSNNSGYFKKNNITRIISVMNNFYDYNIKLPINTCNNDKLCHTIIKLNDKGDVNINKYFNKVNYIIDSNLNGSTYIHCHAGISRSVTLCLAYMIQNDYKTKKYNYTNLNQVINQMLLKRPISNPNCGFLGQLARYFVNITSNNDDNRYIPENDMDDDFQFE